MISLDIKLQAVKKKEDIGYAFVKPYDDLEVITGQATCFYEMTE